MIEYFKDLDHYAKVKLAYNELDTFEKGQGGLQYYPVDPTEHKKWQEQRDKKAMHEYEKREAQKKRDIHNQFLEINDNLKAQERIKHHES